MNSVDANDSADRLAALPRDAWEAPEPSSELRDAAFRATARVLRTRRVVRHACSVAALLAGVPRRDEGAALQFGLDDDDGPTNAADDAVACGKHRRHRFHHHARFGDEGA